jgi:cysteinyl-tRNA synthetase
MFPHHDNELAQSEAYYGHQQWVLFISSLSALKNLS